jgi:antitoxin component YwqK of YwqJK toxin-antitoxin module
MLELNVNLVSMINQTTLADFIMPHILELNECVTEVWYTFSRVSKRFNYVANKYLKKKDIEPGVCGRYRYIWTELPYYDLSHRYNLLFWSLNKECGLEHGLFHIYTEKGKLIGKTSFNKGMYHGPDRTYSENGILLEERNFLNNKLHGVNRKWADNGELILEINYQLGSRHGAYREWTPDMRYTYSKNSRYTQKQGKWKYDGIKHSYNFNLDQLDGLQYIWYKYSGGVHSIKQYKNGVKHGVQKTFSPKDKLIKKKKYKNGQLVSVQTF